MTRVACISDQHQQTPELPECDIVLNAGDLTFAFYGDLVSQQKWLIQTFRPWAQAQPAKHHVVVAGNHDQCVEKWGWPSKSGFGQDRWDGIHYLQDQAIELEGLKIHGTPWQPFFYNWAFNAPERMGEDFLREKFGLIPPDTDIIICHGPPKGFGDSVGDPYAADRSKQPQAGSVALLEAIDRVKPKLVVCGHIHSGFGTYYRNGTTIVNAALVNDKYQLDREAVVIDL